MRKLTLALSTAALAIAGAAIAQTAPAPRAPKPDMTRAEAQAKAEAAFARVDANKDGTLNEADRAARRAGMFDRIDTDRNGSISRAEFDAMQAQHGDRAGMDRKGPGGHHAMMGGRMGGMDSMGGARGPVTRQAFVDRALSRFDRADANRDGIVTQAERNAARETMREQWKARRPATTQG